MPHSWHTVPITSGRRASIQQKTGLSRSRSQHGLLEVGDGGLGAAVVMVGEELGAVVGEGGGGDGGDGGGGDGGGGEGGEGGGGQVPGQQLPRLVPPIPMVYDVPTVPTLTRGPHSPALLYT